MTKGDVISGTVSGTAKEVKHSKKGQPFTGVKVDGAWFQVWGDRTAFLPGQPVELEVSWIAPGDGPVFCTMRNSEKPAEQKAEPKTIEARVAQLEEKCRRLEVQVGALAAKDVPEGMPF